MGFRFRVFRAEDLGFRVRAGVGPPVRPEDITKDNSKKYNYGVVVVMNYGGSGNM